MGTLNNVNRRTIDARSDELLNSLQRAGVGNRPIVWVAHSMGGLLVKQVLIKGTFCCPHIDVTNECTQRTYSYNQVILG